MNPDLCAIRCLDRPIISRIVCPPYSSAVPVVPRIGTNSSDLPSRRARRSLRRARNMRARCTTAVKGRCARTVRATSGNTRTAKNYLAMDLFVFLVRKDFRRKGKMRGPDVNLLCIHFSSYPKLIRVVSYQRSLCARGAKKCAVAKPACSGYARREPQGLRGQKIGSRKGIASLASLINRSDHGKEQRRERLVFPHNDCMWAHP